MTQIWLFQANPSEYKLVDEIPRRVSTGDFWLVKQLRDDLRTGHKVILWQAGNEGGVYGFGAIARKPYKTHGEWRVDIRYEPLLKQPVFKRELRRHPLLRKLGVLKMPRGRNPFPVKEDEWQALQDLISKDKDCVSIFTPYKKEEDRFTNGLVALLQLSSRCDGPLPVSSFLRDLLGIEPRGETGSFRVLRGYDGHADAELCGAASCIRFETKIESGALDEKQVQRHLKWLERAPQDHKLLVLLTPDDGSSSYIERFLASKYIKSFCSKGNGRAVMHLEWKKVYEQLKTSVADCNATAFSRLVSQFLDQIHDRIFEQDFAGVITKIAFGADTGVFPGAYLEALQTDRAWHTPRPYKELDGTGRKLLLYDGDRKGITAEVEIKKVEHATWDRDFPSRNVFANKPRRFKEPISLDHIRSVPGFENFGRYRKDRSAFRNVTREQYRQLIGGWDAKKSAIHELEEEGRQ